MANITPVSTPILEFGDRGARVVVWGPMANGDVGLPIKMPGKSDRSVQVFGTFGAAGNLRIEGTNELAAAPANYATLTDPQGNSLDFTAAKIEQIEEITHQIRPRVTAGDGTTSLTVTMLIKGEK